MEKKKVEDLFLVRSPGSRAKEQLGPSGGLCVYLCSQSPVRRRDFPASRAAMPLPMETACAA